MKYSALTQIVLKGAVAIALLAGTPVTAYAQEIPDWAETTQHERAPATRQAAPDAEMQGPPDFPDTPLDPAGLALLAAAGGALAVRRLRATPA